MGNMGDWILSAAMTRREGEHLCRGGAPLNHFTGQDTPWNIHMRSAAKPEAYFRRKGKEEEHGSAGKPVNLAALHWRYPHAGVADLPSKLTATQLKGRFQDEEVAEDTQESRTYRRPISFREPDFVQQEKTTLSPAQAGTALHLFMQLCDPERAATRQGAREELSRLTALGCMTELQAKSCQGGKQAVEFFQSDLGQRARAQQMEREFKFSLLAEGGTYYGPEAQGEQVLLQGVIDLWFRELEGITVVDFKTDHIRKGEEAQRAETYRRQLEVYTAALEEITGLPVAHRYLWFFQTGTAVELTERHS
jgi:ATP-dependent helicase/nuclease subunit A